jgi:hypothetical protein
MPPTTTSSSRSPPGQSGRIGSFSSPIQFAPKTPERRRDPTRSAPDRTALSFGTSILQELTPDDDQAPKYNSSGYEGYIARDFEDCRVFVDTEVFMKRVLRVPENWRKLWGPIIKRIKDEQAFSIAHSDYSRQCKTPGPPEERFYKPLVEMTNAILGSSLSSQDECIKAQTHKGFLPHLYSGERVEQHVRHSRILCAPLLQVLGAKPSGSALIDGSSMPRLKVNGKSVKTSDDVVL